MRAVFALEEALKAKDIKYASPYCPTYNFFPLAFSTCGEHSSSVQDLVKELGKLNTEIATCCLVATDQAKLEASTR